MNRFGEKVWGGPAAVAIVAAVCVAQGAEPTSGPQGHSASRQIRPRDSLAGQSLLASETLPRGIVSYGVGAARGQEPSPEPAGAQGGAPAEPVEALLGATRKISGSPMAGRVTAFRISPDGERAVFIA